RLRATATGWSPATAAYSPTVTPAFTAQPATFVSISRLSVWRRRVRATATGWSPATAAYSPTVTPAFTAQPATFVSISRLSVWRLHDRFSGRNDHHVRRAPAIHHPLSRWLRCRDGDLNRPTG